MLLLTLHIDKITKRYKIKNTSRENETYIVPFIYTLFVLYYKFYSIIHHKIK